MFDFFMNTRLHFGVGSSHDLTELLLAEGWSHVGMVIDQNVRNIQQVKELIHSVEANCGDLVVENCTISEPSYDYLEEIRKSFMQPTLQVVVGIGGGSALDVAKGIAALVNNKEAAIQYRGFNKMTEPVLPIITVPTIGGSGSEITPNASFVDIKEKRKLGINGEAIRPKYALIDPQLSISCPKSPTISAGIDAIVHAVDSFISTGHNTISRVFSAEGFKRVFKNLTLVLDDPTNLSFREEVMIGALFAAMGMMNSGGGPTSVLSYPLGVHYNVPHGIAGGVFLPHVVEHNIQCGVTDYAHLYSLMDDANVSLSIEEQSEQFLKGVQKVWDMFDIPRDITRYGFEVSDIEKFVSEAMGMKAGLDGNPVPFYENEIHEVLRELI